MDPREKRDDESWAEYGARMASMGIAPVESPMLAGPMTAVPYSMSVLPREEVIPHTEIPAYTGFKGLSQDYGDSSSVYGDFSPVMGMLPDMVADQPVYDPSVVATRPGGIPSGRPGPGFSKDFPDSGDVVDETLGYSWLGERPTDTMPEFTPPGTLDVMPAPGATDPSFLENLWDHMTGKRLLGEPKPMEISYDTSAAPVEKAEIDVQTQVDTFADMPEETKASRSDMAKAIAEATARNVAGKLGIDLGPMDTNMSEEGLEKVLEAAWENKQSYPNNEVALTTLQAGALGLNEQDESAYDTMIGSLPASAITLSPAGLSFYDPKGFQIGSKAAGTDENITHTKEIAKKAGFHIPDWLVDTIGVATGVQPVAALAPYQGGGIDKPQDALYYAGYDTPAVAEPAPQPAGPSAADIERDKQAAINARNAANARQAAINAQMAIEMAARQKQQQEALAAEQARQAQVAQAAHQAQQAAAQQALKEFYSSRAWQEEGAAVPAGLIDVATQIDTFASGNPFADRVAAGPAARYGGGRGDPVGREAAIEARGGGWGGGRE
jgi:hypothetical protein